MTEVQAFPGGAIAIVVGPCPSVPPDAHSFRARASWRQTGRECYIEKGGATPEGPSTPVGTGVWLCACTYHSPSFFRNPEKDERKESITD